MHVILIFNIGGAVYIAQTKSADTVDCNKCVTEGCWPLYQFEFFIKKAEKKMESQIDMGISLKEVWVTLSKRLFQT